MKRETVTVENLIEKYLANSDFRLGVAMESMQKQIGRLLFGARISQGITHDDLAAQLRVPPKLLMQLEAGRGVCDVSLLTLCQWVHRLGFKITFEFVPEGSSMPSSILRVEL